jgi:hypothetical protein
MNPFEMTVLIVLIVTIGRVLTGRSGKRADKQQALIADRDGVSAAEAARLRGDVARLNDRMQVLERLAIDPAKRLSDEIESLKDPRN